MIWIWNFCSTFLDTTEKLRKKYIKFIKDGCFLLTTTKN